MIVKMSHLDFVHACAGCAQRGARHTPHPTEDRNKVMYVSRRVSVINARSSQCRRVSLSSQSASRRRPRPVDVIVASPRPGWGVEPALPWRRCTGGQPKTGKLWTASTFTRDYGRFMAELPHYLSAYVVPGRALDPVVIESVTVTVNTINTCRTAGCTGSSLAWQRQRSTRAHPRSHHRLRSGGGSRQVRDAFDKLASSIGYGKALSVRALCWALLWGKTTGNSINSVRSKLLTSTGSRSRLRSADVPVLWPALLIIGILNAALVYFPHVPKWFSAIFGAILWVPQALHLLTAGVVSLALRILVAPSMGSRSKSGVRKQ